MTKESYIKYYIFIYLFFIWNAQKSPEVVPKNKYSSLFLENSIQIYSLTRLPVLTISFSNTPVFGSNFHRQIYLFPAVAN